MIPPCIVEEKGVSLRLAVAKAPLEDNYDTSRKSSEDRGGDMYIPPQKDFDTAVLRYCLSLCPRREFESRPSSEVLIRFLSDG